jgi:DNA-binding response OmpR family regulator
MSTFTSSHTISIVEDEADVRLEMASQLENLGLKVKAFGNANDFYRYLAIKPMTIVVLDIGLPGEDGISVCKYLREHNQSIGIVFVTKRDTREDRLAGLAAGADAYMTKPVDIDELALVLKRLALRFIRHKRSNDQPRQGSVTSWHMEPNSIYLVAPNGAQIKVTSNEGQILRALLNKKGMACTHAELGISIELNPDELNKHRIEVILNRLSSKVKRLSGLTLPLQSFRSIGYGLMQDIS